MRGWDKALVLLGVKRDPSRPAPQRGTSSWWKERVAAVAVLVFALVVACVVVARL
jgi:hypothetical protein